MSRNEILLDEAGVQSDFVEGHRRTDIDGIRLDPADPDTLVNDLSLREAESEIGNAIRGWE